ncbi:hypothetical protein DLD77_05530 [Chitinophaga alhagiae]|uniref:Secretion system C-terminal sorting domain-containing protein n=1 Tax=Chitinophaga alhagiae TaxID=2203219 RepID=A0ABM6WBC1_9BACT|nr:T9SS type A sorting domain-containing protein [Chitinophaga alhagiae]AWO01189.1 hypothetical protein DLD77_05530 [Chitinophaga alhagiae]
MKVFLWLLLLSGAFFNAKGQASIKLSEYSPSNKTIAAGDGKVYNWLEINNTAYESLELSEFELIVTPENGSPATVALPPGKIMCGEFKMIWFGASTSTIVGQDIYVAATVQNVRSVLELRHKTSNLMIDIMHVPSLLKDDETLNEQHLLNLPPVMLPGIQSTPYARNLFASSWSKLTNHTAFQGRDSSPNALLLFKNKLWVMAGWRYEPENGDYHSRSDIYNSDDGINWTLVNPSPPYQPYSGFIVYKDKMWAYDDTGIWNSDDGVTWEFLGTSPVRASSRVLLVNDTIWFVDTYGNAGYSPDGLNFTLTRNGDAPWGLRDWPGFVYHRNKFWVYIGRKYIDGVQHATNDVWSSSDGISWELMTDEAVLPSRFWHMYGAFEDKMWIIGGASWDSVGNANNGNFNDAWYSENGKDWKLLSQDNYPNRHAAMIKNFNDRLYFMCGYGGLSLDRLYNDVWVFNYRIYYSRKGQDLSELSSWGTVQDGTGLQPLSFDQSNAIYVVTNDSAYTLSGSWQVAGKNSKIILGNGRDSVTLKVNPGVNIPTGMHLTERSRLEWESSSPPNIARTAPSSTVAFINTETTLPGVQNGYYNLEVSNTQLTTASSVIKVGHNLRMTGSVITDNGNSSGIWIYGSLYADNNTNTKGVNLEMRGSEDAEILPLNGGEPIIGDLVIHKDDGSVTLGTNLHILNMFTYVKGDLQKNGFQLMFDNKGSMRLAGNEQGLKLSNFITPGSEVYDLMINNPNGAVLGQSININGILRMVNGQLVLHEYDLGIAYALGGSEQSYVQADSSGMLRFKANLDEVTLPIGNKKGFMPVTISSNATEGIMGLNFSNIEKLDNLESARFVHPTWNLDAGTMTDIDVNVELSWKQSDEGELFDRNECGAAIYRLEGFLNKQRPSAASPDTENSFSVKARMKLAGTIVVGDSASTATKQYQTVSVEPSGVIEKKYGDPSFTLSAGSSSGLPVIFLSDNDVLMETDSHFDIMKAGTSVISVFSEGSDDYVPSDTVKVTVIVTQALQPPLEIDTSTLVKRYDDEPFTLLEETSSIYGPIVVESATPEVVQVHDDTIIEINSVGRALLAVHSPGNENYLPSDTVYVTVVVKRALQNITINSLVGRKVLNVDTPFVPVIFDSGLSPTVSISNTAVAAFENGRIVLKSSGETNVTIEQPGNKYYAPFQRQHFLLKVMEWGTLKVYPNPTTAWLNVVVGDAVGSEYYYQLHDIQGRRILYGPINPRDNLRIDLSAYPSNTYILKVTGPSYSKSVKIIKQ